MLVVRSRPRQAALLLVPAMLLTAGVAGCSSTSRGPDAARHSTLIVVGTSDVVDSNLEQAVIKPGFEAAYPTITLNYVSQGSGAAIATAEAGAAGALLVHAASLENQFVGSGFSAEKYGRAVFYGDYVLLGPARDPAGVLSHAPHDIVTALERIAAAGAAGKANFVSRGGTPGTTVKEHAIWTLTSHVRTCTVATVDGGGASPSTAAGACPTSTSTPSWYHQTGLTQAANVENADVCNYDHANCYVLTDRGTFQYLRSTSALHSLRIVTRNNASSARGSATLLVNSFHVYAINPAKFAGHPNVHLNEPAAEDFLTWLTSPAAQRAVSSYMSGQGDPPFLADAAPRLTASVARAGRGRVTVRGVLANVAPGSPTLDGVVVTLEAHGRGSPATTVTSTTTARGGRYQLRYHPRPSVTYTVSTGPITKIEDASLQPAFGDILAPSTAPVPAA